MATMSLKQKFDMGFVEVGDYIGFQADWARCTLMPEETGWKDEQTLSTEADMKWQLAIIGGKLALLADASTEQKIWLGGRIGGIQNGVGAIQKYVQTCWNSKKFHAKGICINKTQFEELPTFLKDSVKECYWLADFGSQVVRVSSIFGVYYAENRHARLEALLDNVYGKYWKAMGVRPAVILQPDIMIDDDNNLVPFDEAEEGTSTENSSVPSGLVSLGTEEEKMLAQAQKSDAKANLEVMIAEEEKKLEEQKKQFEEYITHQKERLAKMKELLSEL